MNSVNSAYLPNGLEGKTFNPFLQVGSTDATLTHEKFEYIRTNCSYHLPYDGSIHKLAEKHLNILHLNIRSILSDSKFEEFQLFLNSVDISWQVICLSETWLTDEMLPLRQLNGYTAYFNNRNGKMGGGVAIYLNNQYIQHSSQIMVLDTSLETVFIKCKLSSSMEIIVGQTYKPPSMESAQFIEEFTKCLEKVDQMNKTTVLCGDFNIDLFALLDDNQCQDFFNALTSFGYLPTISKTTRLSDSKQSLIDNIFCNNIEFINNSGIIYDDTTDHYPVFVNCSPQLSPKMPTFHMIFDKSKYEELSCYLSEQLQTFTDITDPEIACNTVISVYKEGIKKFSKKVKHNRKSGALKPWISPAILASINRRHSLFIKKNKHPSKQNRDLYNNYRNVLNDTLRLAKKKYIQEQLEINRTSSKKLWQLLNGIVKGHPTNNQLPETFLNINGDHISDKEEIADSFNNFFISVGENLQQKIPKNSLDPLGYIEPETEHVFDNMSYTNPTELREIVKNMKNVGAGIDGINASLFKRTFPAIINEIVHLINICLQCGVFPDALKIAIVKPIYKAGDQSSFNNYRPISILPYISKILEKIIHLRIMTYVLDANILHAKQFGFQKNKSTYMPLLLLQEKITKSMENGNLVCGIYLDLKKAFDTVDHSLLIGKLERYGFVGTSLNLIKSYLTNRRQCVDYNGIKSNLKPVLIGVPQGSILGPLLFLLYINDFPNASKNTTFLQYADDTAIFFESDTANKLQLLIESESLHICNWLMANKLTLNTQKTVFQVYKSSDKALKLSIKLNNVEILETATVKYLGVYIDSGLKWSAHISHTALIISRNIGIISRVKYFLNKQSLLLLYNSLILPYINYCCLVWGFTYQTYVNKIEILQKRIVRIIDNQHRLAHSNPIFKTLNILKTRDLARQQLISVMHRKITGNLPKEIGDLFILSDVQNITRSVRHFEEKFTRKLYCTRTASWQGPRLWNAKIAPHFSLTEVRNASKTNIKKHVKTQFLVAYE